MKKLYNLVTDQHRDSLYMIVGSTILDNYFFVMCLLQLFKIIKITEIKSVTSLKKYYCQQTLDYFYVLKSLNYFTSEYFLNLKLVVNLN